MSLNNVAHDSRVARASREALDSREAATAHSRGRKPTDRIRNEHVSREAAAADANAVAAPRLAVVCRFLCGLTPAASAPVKAIDLSGGSPDQGIVTAL
jgi:hypothetical protein